MRSQRSLAALPIIIRRLLSPVGVVVRSLARRTFLMGVANSSGDTLRVVLQLIFLGVCGDEINLSGVHLAIRSALSVTLCFWVMGSSILLGLVFEDREEEIEVFGVLTSGGVSNESCQSSTLSPGPKFWSDIRRTIRRFGRVLLPEDELTAGMVF